MCQAVRHLRLKDMTDDIEDPEYDCEAFLSRTVEARSPFRKETIEVWGLVPATTQKHTYEWVCGFVESESSPLVKSSAKVRQGVHVLTLTKAACEREHAPCQEKGKINRRKPIPETNTKWIE